VPPELRNPVPRPFRKASSGKNSMLKDELVVGDAPLREQRKEEDPLVLRISKKGKARAWIRPLKRV